MHCTRDLSALTVTGCHSRWHAPALALTLTLMPVTPTCCHPLPLHSGLQHCHCDPTAPEIAGDAPSRCAVDVESSWYRRPRRTRFEPPAWAPPHRHSSPRHGTHAGRPCFNLLPPRGSRMPTQPRPHLNPAVAPMLGGRTSDVTLVFLPKGAPCRPAITPPSHIQWAAEFLTCLECLCPGGLN